MYSRATDVEGGHTAILLSERTAGVAGRRSVAHACYAALL
jgi:hypothetical protein